MRAKTKADTVIDALGGTKKVAEMFEITPSAVTQWRTKGIPKVTLKYLFLKKPKIMRELAL